MKNYFYFSIAYLLFGFNTIVAQDIPVIEDKEKAPTEVIQASNSSSDNVVKKGLEKTDIAAKSNLKNGQIEKLRSRISSAKEKLERERLGGELPGDYIAAQEEKIKKMETKLEDAFNKEIDEKSVKKSSEGASLESETSSVKKNSKNDEIIILKPGKSKAKNKESKKESKKG